MNQVLVSLWDHPMIAVQWIAVSIAALVAAILDMRYRRIPNALTLPLFALGLLWALWVDGGVGVVSALAGAGVAMLPFVLMFLFASGGAGDAKLMAAIGAWLGLRGASVVVICVMIAGGLVALGYFLVSRRKRDIWVNLNWIGHSLVRTVTGNEKDRVLPSVEYLHTMPYGLAIFLGTAAASVGMLL